MWNGLSKIKIYNNHIIFKKIKLKILWKFRRTSLINSSFDDALFYFDTILTYVLSFFFFFFLFYKRIVFFLKFHYKSIIFLEFIQKIYDDSYQSLWQHE